MKIPPRLRSALGAIAVGVVVVIVVWGLTSLMDHGPGVLPKMLNPIR